MTLRTNNSLLGFDIKLSGRNTYDTTTLVGNPVKIKPSDGAADDIFGRSVAVGSGRIVVGSYIDNDPESNAGSAYIFNLSGTQLAKIKLTSRGSLSQNDLFGASVAIGGDRIVIGAYGDEENGNSSGAAYIFDLNGSQLAKIKAFDGATNDEFGYSVAVGCGRIVVGAPSDDTVRGSAYIFDMKGTLLTKIVANDRESADSFGHSVAVGSGRIVVGAWSDDTPGQSNSGSAYIFDLNGVLLRKILGSDTDAGDNFGYSVSVGSGRIVVGAPNNFGSTTGSAYIFDLNGNQIAALSTQTAFTNFGAATSVKSGKIIIGVTGLLSGRGSFNVYTLNGALLQSTVAGDGQGGDSFGFAVCINSGSVIIGAPGDDDNGSASGSAYIYTTPNQTHMLDLLD